MKPGLQAANDGVPAEIAVDEIQPGVRLVTVACELDMVSTPSLSEILTEELRRHPRAIIVDLTGCELLSGHALRALHGAHEHVGPRTWLVLAGAHGTTARVLRITELDAMILSYPTIGEALRALVDAR
jgi:anti-anti-sigma factor